MYLYQQSLFYEKKIFQQNIHILEYLEMGKKKINVSQYQQLEI